MTRAFKTAAWLTLIPLAALGLAAGYMLGLIIAAKADGR